MLSRVGWLMEVGGAVCGGARWVYVWYHRRVPYWSAVGRRQAGGLSPYSQPTREPLKKYKRMMNKHGMEIFWADDDKNYGMDKLQTRE